MTLIKSKISKRGNSQIELKIDYPLDQFIKNKDKKKRFSVDCYIFLPIRLGISKETYTINDFFSDFISYTRFDVANLTLDDMLDMTNALSPLTRIENLIRNDSYFSEKLLNEIIYELKTFYNIFHARLKENSSDIQSLKHKIQENLDEIYKIFDENILFAEKIIEKLNSFKEFFYSAKHKVALFKCYQWVDEGCSVDIEKFCWRIYSRAEKIKNKNLMKKCIEVIDKQVKYRKDENYGTFVYKYNKKNNEAFIFRLNSIKKWAESALYVNTSQSKKNKGMSEFLYAIAAGIAMFISLLLTVFALNHVQNQAMYWLIGGVFVYMLKDRMKESLRLRSASILPKIVANREIYVVDPKDQKKVGKIRDWVEFVPKENLEEDIRTKRDAGKNWLDKLLAKEKIIHFKRHLILNNQLLENHDRLINIVDIIRFDLRRTFYKMDKGQENLYVKTDEKLEKVVAERVYHFNLIVKFAIEKNDSAPIITRHRIIANQSDGIIRIEKVDMY